MSFTREKTQFLSSDGKTQVNTLWWIPEGAPKAIFQVSHGMAEYIERYSPFCEYLANNGYLVCGIDYLGHGDTSKEKDYGYLADKDGWVHITNDVHQLTRIAKAKYPGLKNLLFGHSMGSFVVRNYARQWSNDIDALIICGTGGKNPMVGMGLALLKTIKLFKGGHSKSSFATNLAFGKYLDRIKDAKTPFDWLSVDEDNVAAYLKDPKCGFEFTVSGYIDLMSVLKAVSDDSAFSSVRKDLPILLIAGSEDPVGDYGKGVKEVYDRFIQAGAKDAEIKIYDGMRHEILRETDKETVWNDVTDWCTRKGI